MNGMNEMTEGMARDERDDGASGADDYGAGNGF